MIKNAINWLGVFLLPLYGMLVHCRVTPNNFGYPFMHLGGKILPKNILLRTWTGHAGLKPIYHDPFFKQHTLRSGQVRNICIYLYRLEIFVPRCVVNLLAIKTFCLSSLWDDLIVIADDFHKPGILLRKASINSEHYILLRSWKLISTQSLWVLFKKALHTTITLSTNHYLH